MSDIYITQANDTSFEMKGCSDISGRHIMKLNIYLNSIPNVQVERAAESIIIIYGNSDSFAISKSIRGLIEFLNKLSCTITLDENTKRLVEDITTHEADTVATTSKLRDIKKHAVEGQPDFINFCDTCDKFLKIKLRPYQYKAAYLLSMGKGGFDFSVPGAGKTIITYTTYKYLKLNALIGRILVIGPISSYNAWFDEYITCFGQTPDFENLAEESVQNCKLYLNASANNHKEVTFINADKVRLVSAEIAGFLARSTVLLVIDEAHKIKNPDAVVTKSVLEITKRASARVILTGTPMPNGFEDLFTLTKTYAPFDDILPYNYNQLRLMTKNDATPIQMAKIRECIYPYYSRISKKYLLEAGELQAPKYHIVSCNMDDVQRSLYERLNGFFGKISEDIDEDLLESLKKAILIRKMQISANPALLQKSLVNSMDELRDQYSDSIDKENAEIDHLIKADKDLMDRFNDSGIIKVVSQYDQGKVYTAKNCQAVELATSLVNAGQKVLIWDIFVKNMAVLKAMIEAKLGRTVELINGSISGADRQLALKRFREGASMVLLANPATLAESISLHKVCQNAIYVNRNFNAAQYIQSKDRIHRINMPIGTTGNYYFILNNDSVDSCIDERLKKKEARMLAILDADDIEVGGSEMEDSSIMSAQDIEESYMR